MAVADFCRLAAAALCQGEVVAAAAGALCGRQWLFVKGRWQQQLQQLFVGRQWWWWRFVGGQQLFWGVLNVT